MSYRTAIIADWLPVFGGAEHVIAELHTLWPDAPIFTTIADRKKLGPLKNADIRPTKLQWLYALTGRHQWLLPCMPKAIEDIDTRGFDLVVSSSHAVGKGIIPESSAVHVCYCHTPMRYAWEMEQQYLEDFHVPGIFRKFIQQKLKTIRRWDLVTAKRVDVFIANSSTTQERIKRIFNRESIVIPPPVHDRFFRSNSQPLTSHHYYLAVGRLVPYKRFDLLIEVANTLKLPLKIAGQGQDERRLKKLAGPTVEFLGFVRDEEMPALYAEAKALLHPQFEDAGVTAIEAQACGTPVIAFGKGGALDTVIEGATGTFFPEQTAPALTDALKRFDQMTFDRAKIRSHAQQFSAEEFRKKVLAVTQEAVHSYHATRPALA